MLTWRMFNFGIVELTMLILLALALVRPGKKLQSLVHRRSGRPRRSEPQPVAGDAPPLDRLDWLLVITGLALSFALVALLSRH